MQSHTHDVPPPQQERSKRAADRILEAARELLQSSDFSKVSLMQIAAEAGVSQGTLYARFRTKNALLHCLHEEYCSRTRAEIEQAGGWLEQLDAPVEQRIKLAVQVFLPHMTGDRQIVRNFRRAGLDDPAFLARQTRFDRDQQGLAAQLVFRCMPELDRTEEMQRLIHRTVRMVVALGRDVVDTGVQLDDPESPLAEPLADAIADLALRCLGLDPGAA
ncbi:MAG: helix-turn-helix domain-containing protein [Myxococcota bacterium]|nr:helix-turn-helix domain-containing protein [Myxococcota bacterium]